MQTAVDGVRDANQLGLRLYHRGVPAIIRQRIAVTVATPTPRFLYCTPRSALFHHRRCDSTSRHVVYNISSAVSPDYQPSYSNGCVLLQCKLVICSRNRF